MSNNGLFECFFCGEKGHGLRRCPQADIRIITGTIARSQEGRITWPDGNNILRNGAETILTAINRELAFRSRVNAECPSSTSLIYGFRYSQPSHTVETEDKDEDEGLKQVYATEVYPVTRPREECKADRAKKLRFEDVYPPPLSKSHKKDPSEDSKENQPPMHIPNPVPASTPVPVQAPVPALYQVPIQPSAQNLPPRPSIPGATIVPYDTTFLPFDPDDNDQIMEDASEEEVLTELIPPPEPIVPKPGPKPRKTSKTPMAPSTPGKPLKIAKPAPKNLLRTPATASASPKLQSQCSKD